MSPPARLGGFKILKDVVWISLIQTGENEDFPAKFLHGLAEEKINLTFLTSAREGRMPNLSIVVQSSDAVKVSQLIQQNPFKLNRPEAKGAILSIFPHRSNPEIIASLFDIFGGEGIAPDALANSNSAVSAVLGEEVVARVASALFGPFQFSAYRTPEDWKLAENGKRELYKEVVASYQEKRPKVYALEWQDGQELLQAKLNTRNLPEVGAAFKDLARLGFVLSFLIMNPSKEKKETNLFFCLPESQKVNYSGIINGLPSRAVTAVASPVALFFMNGPHFGDRYGIASELLIALNSAQVELLALSCSVASITGVVAANQIQLAIEAIQGCFEIPSVIKKT